MNHREHAHTAAYMIVFALMFVIIGTSTPRMWYMYAPTDFFITIYDYQVSDVDLSISNEQQFTFVREVKIPTYSHIIRELKLIRETDERNVLTMEDTDYFERGLKTVSKVRKLPCDLENGSYYWVLAIEYKLAPNVIRVIETRSNTFEVTRGEIENGIISTCRIS